MENPSYFAIIPAKVRYDKNLVLGARMLYGEITALCNKEGYCWASNKYFAELYGISVGTASSWVNSLVKCGYISSEIIYKDKQVIDRHLRILLTEQGGIPKNQDTPTENPEHNSKCNNIKEKDSINTKVLITQSVNDEEKSDNTIKEIREDKNMLFNLPEKKILNTTSLPNNHAAVKRYLSKINGKELLPLKEFTTTDWMLSFIIEYNKVFEPYVLPPMGPSFNCLVEPFSNLLKDIPLHNRISVFREFVQIVKQGNRLPYSWVGGFTLEQMYSGYNFKNVKAEFDRLSEYISLSIQETALLTKVSSKNSGIQYF